MSGTRKSITLLPSTDRKMEVVGDKIKAGSYFGYTNGLSTIQIMMNNFVGGVGIQGTLSLNPKEDDWFYINLRGIKDFDELPLLTYPKDPLNPTGHGSAYVSHVGDTGTETYTFEGNFVYIRAIVTREHIQPLPEQPSDGTWNYGQVDRILICI